MSRRIAVLPNGRVDFEKEADRISETTGGMMQCPVIHRSDKIVIMQSQFLGGLIYFDPDDGRCVSLTSSENQIYNVQTFQESFGDVEPGPELTMDADEFGLKMLELADRGGHRLSFYLGKLLLGYDFIFSMDNRKKLMQVLGWNQQVSDYGTHYRPRVVQFTIFGSPYCIPSNN